MIRFLPSPAKSRAALRQVMNSGGLRLDQSPEGTATVPKPRRLLMAHPVYFANMPRILVGKGLQYAKLVAWRYFVEPDAVGVLGIAEVNVKSRGHHQFCSFGAGPQIALHRQLLESLASQAAGQQTYSFRLLRIPSIRVLAVWLRSEKRGRDLVIPMVPPGHLLTNNQFYERAEFEAAIKIEVERLKAARESASKYLVKTGTA